MIVPQADDDIEMLTNSDLVLHIGRDKFDVGDSVARRSCEGDGRIDRIVEVERGAWAECAVETHVARFLVTIFDTEQQLVIQRTGFDIPDEVGLPDQVFTLGRVRIGIERYRVRSGHRTIGVHIDVEFVIIAIEQGAGEFEVVGQLAIEAQLCDMRLQRGAVYARNAEEQPVITAHRCVGLARRSGDGGHAAVGHAIIICIFVREAELPILAEVNGKIRVPGIAFAINKAAVAFHFLIGCVDPYGRLVAQRGVEIGRKVPAAKAGDAGAGRAKAFVGHRGFLHAVNDAAAAAAAEDQRIGAFEDLDTLHIIKPAIILHVVAHAIEEEVCGGVLPAQRDLVTIALPLPHGGAGHIAQHFAEAVLRLIVKLFAGDDMDSLRNVKNRSVGLGGGDDILCHIATARTRHDDRAAFLALITRQLDIFTGIYRRCQHGSQA